MISVVIPTINEAARLPALLSALRAQDAAHEVIVVDGGSQDAKINAARGANSSVVPGATLRLKPGGTTRDRSTRHRPGATESVRCW